MIIKKYIDIQREIDIELCPEDLKDLYLEDYAGTQAQVLGLISRACTVLRSVEVSMLDEKQIPIIYDIILTAAEKFKPNDPPRAEKGKS